MAATRKVTVDLSSASFVVIPGVSLIINKKLAEFQEEISKKTKSDIFKTTGYKSKFFSNSVVENKIVPRGVARGFKKCIEGLDPATSSEDALNALVEFVAMMKHRSERGLHRGRDPSTQAFYASFWGILNNVKNDGKGEGATIFPDHEIVSQGFDALVNLKLIQFGQKYLHKNQSTIKKIAVKVRLGTSDKQFEKFMEKVQIDQQNLLEFKSVHTSLLEDKNLNTTYLAKGLDLLAGILVRSVGAFSKTNLTIYKQDFLKTLSVVAPGRPTDADKLKVENFFDYHMTLITTLTDRKRRLYAEAVVNVLVTALCVTGIGDMVIPPTLLQNPILQNVLQNTLPEIAEEYVDEKHFLKDKYLTPNPIAPVAKERTRSEIYKYWVNLDKAAHIGVVGGTIAAGVLVGPIGVAVAGGVSLLIYAGRFFNSYMKFSSIEKSEQIAKDEHENQFCKFLNVIKADSAYSATLDKNTFVGLEERTARLNKKASSTAKLLGKMPPVASSTTTPAITPVANTSVTAAAATFQPPTAQTSSGPVTATPKIF